MASPKRALSELDRLCHMASKEVIDHLFDGPWITLYARERSDERSVTLFSGLVAKAGIEGALAGNGWDVHIGNGRPGYVVSAGAVKYRRLDSKHFEPLVLIRDFTGVKPQQIELSEELRLFLDLHWDHQSGKLVRLDESGDDDIVAEISDNLVRIRKPALNEYLAARQMHLAIYFEFDEKLTHGANPVPEDQRQEDVRLSDRVWGRWMTDDALPIISRLMGKRLLEPPKRPRAKELFTRRRKCEEFIIGYDDEGNHLVHTSDPDQLSNYFGANPGAPHYLTAVHFERTVLDRYFADPSKYTLSDGYLERAGLWGMRLDNNRADRIIAHLGDLGRDLPHKEQLHWKAHNIAPEGTFSEVAVRRAFLAEFADPSAPDLVFKLALEKFNRGWLERKGWPLFLPLSHDDRHVLERLHVPSSNAAPEFDSQILGLAKLLVDSLNDKGLTEALGSKTPEEKSIAKLERYLKVEGYPHSNRDIALLRSIQSIRSSGAAHRKGQTYAKLATKLQLTGRSSPEIITELLEKLTVMLADLDAHISQQTSPESS